MKKLLMVGAAGLSGLLVWAANPEPKVVWALNEGGGEVVAGTGEWALPGRVVNAENTFWGAGRDGGKGLFFKGDPAKQRKAGTVRIPLQGKWDYTQAFTLTGWFFPDKAIPRASFSEIVTTTEGDRGKGFRLVFGWNTLRFSTGDGKTMRVIATAESKNPIERDTWNHFAVVYDGKKAALYLNGALAAESPAAEPLAITRGRDELGFGSYRAGVDYGLIGGIGAVKVFNAPLSAAAVMVEAKGLE